jgi:hypothetical protein
MGGGIASVLEFGVRVLALFADRLVAINDDIDLLCSLNEWCESLFDFEQLLHVSSVVYLKDSCFSN